MSGEDERTRRAGAKVAATPRPAAGANPFTDAAAPPPGAPAPAPGKVRRGKPPPGIISAGGVDMARAHASNIRPLADSEQKVIEQAKVVLSVEKADPRRQRTVRRIDMAPGEYNGPMPTMGAGESPWAKPTSETVDKAALPSANLPRDSKAADKAADKAPETQRRRMAGGIWIRLATGVVALLLVAGIGKQYYLAKRRVTVVPAVIPTSEPVVTPPSETAGAEPPVDTALAATTTAKAAESAAPPAATTAEAVAPPPVDTAVAAVPSALPTAVPNVVPTEQTPPPAAPTGTVPRLIRPGTAKPVAPKPTFAPLFTLPGEKKR